MVKMIQELDPEGIAECDCVATPYSYTPHDQKQWLQHELACELITVQRTGGYRIKMSKTKNIVLKDFNGCVYAHLWDNKEKFSITLTRKELDFLLTCREKIGKMLGTLA